MAKIVREIPSYYSKFQCTGNTTCIDNCCNAWLLPLDKKTAEYYQNYEGEFGDTMRENIYQDEHGDWFIRIGENGSCKFLTEDKLCTVRLHAGEHAQACICEVYPRERNIMVGDYRQDRLLIACSEVAKLLYKETGDRLEFIRTEEETEDEEITPELKERTEQLLAFRDGMVEGLQAGVFDASLFGAYESKESFDKLFADAIYFEKHEPTETVIAETRAIVEEAEEWRKKFYDAVPEAKKWLRKTAAYFAHRQLLDTVQDGSIDGPLISVFRSTHILELICLSVFKKKGSFTVDDMVFCAYTFGLTFEISMHNVHLMKEVRNTAKDKYYPDNENSEIRPFFYP
ncbi:MAG: flagellin lysine-N-methylase [Lachnospiraceae bacterium]|nr:flagellin lysine-N-methylase [Lachnospiraceae bacterium]